MRLSRKTERDVNVAIANNALVIKDLGPDQAVKRGMIVSDERRIARRMGHPWMLSIS
jgi:hypothetical protein